MVGDIRILLLEVPFLPFTIHMADGRHIRVPTREHIGFSGMRTTVTNDDNSLDILSGLLMTGLTVDAPTGRLEAK